MKPPRFPSGLTASLLPPRTGLPLFSPTGLPPSPAWCTQQDSSRRPAAAAAHAGIDGRSIDSYSSASSLSWVRGDGCGGRRPAGGGAVDGEEDELIMGKFQLREISPFQFGEPLSVRGSCFKISVIIRG